jgi:hypothetical protein
MQNQTKMGFLPACCIPKFIGYFPVIKAEREGVQIGAT